MISPVPGAGFSCDCCAFRPGRAGKAKGRHEDVNILPFENTGICAFAGHECMCYTGYLYVLYSFGDDTGRLLSKHKVSHTT